MDYVIKGVERSGASFSKNLKSSTVDLVEKKWLPMWLVNLSLFLDLRFSQKPGPWPLHTLDHIVQSCSQRKNKKKLKV